MPCGNSTNTLDVASPSFPALSWFWKAPLAWLAGIPLGWVRRCQYKQLLELDDRLLADIGIPRERGVEAALKSSLKSSWAHLLMWHIYR